MRRVEQSLLAAVAAVFRLPCDADGPAGARLPACPEIRQLTLALGHGGFGFRAATALEADAAFLAGASRAQAAMLVAPDADPATPHPPASFRPFDAPASRASLLASWHGVYDDVAAECGLDATARDLPSSFVHAVLPHMQSAVSRIVSDREGAAFRDSFGVDTAHGRRNTARMRSVACGAASAWLSAVPYSAPLQLSDADFVASGRHRLGLGVPSTVPAPPCLCRGGDAGTPDHAMVCRTNAMMIMRHNILASAWRSIIAKCGNPSSMEPAYAGLRAHGRQGGAAGMRRGDIFAVMADGRLVVADVVVIHAAAATYAARAAATTGAAAAIAERKKRDTFAAMGDGAGYDFVPLATESYGRLGKTALAFLSELGSTAASRNGRVPKSTFVSNALKHLSCALCKGNGRMYHASMFTLARKAGRQFMPGCAVPVADVGEM
jgi:hypothetical protein